MTRRVRCAPDTDHHAVVAAADRTPTRRVRAEGEADLPGRS
ncbi:hypothetical protein PV779_24675 [Streptomyces sp. ID01-9D]|nr:hypothetical protein [Streptomyces sp. ID01-9D]